MKKIIFNHSGKHLTFIACRIGLAAYNKNLSVVYFEQNEQEGKINLISSALQNDVDFDVDGDNIYYYIPVNEIEKVVNIETVWKN